MPYPPKFPILSTTWSPIDHTHSNRRQWTFSQCFSRFPITDGSVTVLKWRGYREFKRQVHIRDETAQRSTVTLSKFAQHVGRSVQAFLNNAQVDIENPVPQWHIGEGGIQPQEIMLIGAIQVSSGGWMPLIQLTRFIF